jgi:hypothetical protein
VLSGKDTNTKYSSLILVGNFSYPEMKFILIGMVIMLLGFQSQSQNSLSVQSIVKFKSAEDSLRQIGDSMVFQQQDSVRQHYIFVFIKTLTKTLRAQNSFSYPFDSVRTMKIVYPDDRKFRIFTFQIKYANGLYRYYGAIQMNTGQLSLFPLIDYAYYFSDAADSITNNQRWFGCIYYQVVQQGKYYFLIGWSGNNYFSNKKIIDVLSFNSKGKPVFGAPVFSLQVKGKPRIYSRYIMEYKKDAQASLHFDDATQMILMDHLTPLHVGDTADKSDYVPDGTYDGFTWKNNQWQFIDEVYHDNKKPAIFPEPLDMEKNIFYNPKQ